MARYKILLKTNIVREYESISVRADRRRVLWTIASLTDDPRPAAAKELPEREDLLRICLKRHRLIYEIDDFKKQITVFRIASRGRQNSTWQSSASGSFSSRD